jgi:hypothetical protein
MFPRIRWRIWIPWIALVAATMGCDDHNSQIAREAADRQAEQNRQMAQVTKEVAAGTHQLVEADAEARKEVIGVHRDLQAERSQLNNGWNELENERRHIASQRRTDSMLVSVATLAGEVSLVLALVAFCWFVLLGVERDSNADSPLNELFVHEILTGELLKLPVGEQPPSLPDPTSQDHSTKCT